MVGRDGKEERIWGDRSWSGSVIKLSFLFFSFFIFLLIFTIKKYVLKKTKRATGAKKPRKRIKRIQSDCSLSTLSLVQKISQWTFLRVQGSWSGRKWFFCAKGARMRLSASFLCWLKPNLLWPKRWFQSSEANR